MPEPAELTPLSEVAASIDAMARDAFADLDALEFYELLDHLCRIGVIQGSCVPQWIGLFDLVPDATREVLRDLRRFWDEGAGRTGISLRLDTYLQEAGL